ncbi:alpha-ribazole phosphatase [Natronincola ferrireducens]|uniref:Alpha-ribazole phosphatase n=1 Tax=Natronincola ferrireducens TaxID=393762 RepID=A0A1G9E0V6_9FIRM|nr:alpha-ribazole phosphatase [Natronincola ferrireducens]SDK69733.1 alpha-ribazole phosphatase [Natronincola ferrireducens]
MTKLYLIRHGETEENANRRFCGWTDVSLNQLGKSQALRLTNAFKNIEIDVMYTSNLRRAKETAEAIKGDKNYPIHEITSLRELNFGRVEGLTIEEIQKNYPEVYRELENDYVRVKFPDGESLQEMHERVVNALEEILHQHREKHIAIIAHSGVIRSMVAHLITGNISYHWNFKVDHCSISIIEKHGDFCVLTALNDTCHLNDI